MSSSEIKNSINSFQDAVKKLSTSINSASVLWKDAKFQELSSSISNIATLSCEVITVGEHYCRAIDQLEMIASEKY